MSTAAMTAFREPIPVALPTSASRVSRQYATTDLADAYEIRLPAGAITDPEALARFVFLHQAPWVGALMRMRDAVMARFGVKTARQLKTNGDRRISIFRIYERSAQEIILGEDDRHLDFRVSVLRTERGDRDERHAVLTLSTVVHCHNRLGRVYLLAIGPFHRGVVKSGLRRAARRGWPMREGDHR